MARKLTESQKLIRRLQSQFTNREIADMLGYKDVDSISRISRGKRNLSTDKLNRANEISEEVKLPKRTPSPKQVKERQKVLRKGGNEGKRKFKSDWIPVSMESYLNGLILADRDKYVNRLDFRQLRFAYYSPVYDVYMLFNRKMKLYDIQPNEVTSASFEFIYQSSFESERRVIQYPFYPITSFTDKVDSFNQVLDDLFTFMFEVDSDRAYSPDDFYSNLYREETLHFLALVGQ